jgi:TfoX/Sxy family transcriptional regulator of competence genes
MSTGPATIRFLLDQLSGAGNVTARPMFGEYGLYCDGKVVGLVCDDTLFLKPTPGALALVASPRYGPAYPGAKPSLVIEDELDDPDAFARLVRAVANDLPEPKPKKAKAPRKPKG